MSEPAITTAIQNEVGAALGVLRPDSCLIRTRGGGADAGGGENEAWSDGATVACRVVPAQRQVIVGVAGGQIVPEADFMVFVPRGTAVSRGDQVVVSRAGQPNRTFEVLNDPAAPSIQFELMLAVKAS